MPAPRPKHAADKRIVRPHVARAVAALAEPVSPTPPASDDADLELNLDLETATDVTTEQQAVAPIAVDPPIFRRGAPGTNADAAKLAKLMTGVEARRMSSGGTIPPGTYRVRVEDASGAERSTNGHDMRTITLGVAEGEHAGRKLFLSLYFSSPEARANAAYYLDVLGVPRTNPLALPIDTLYDADVDVKLRNAKRRKDANVVVDLRRVEGAPIDDGTDPATDLTYVE